MHRTTRTPIFFGRERERERKREREGRAQWERNREEQPEREQGRAREIGRERVGERPTEQETGLTGAKGGWWARADQGKWDATAAWSNQEIKKQGAVAPLSYTLDTLSRAEQPKHDWGCESAAHVRQLEASGQETVDSMRMNGVERQR